MTPEVNRHRQEIIRRLVERGMSPQALQAVFPGWERVIEQVCCQAGEGSGAATESDPASPPTGAVAAEA